MGLYLTISLALLEVLYRNFRDIYFWRNFKAFVENFLESDKGFK
jgi:hypothetical protein